jgi:uncharacterized protein YraI
MLTHIKHFFIMAVMCVVVTLFVTTSPAHAVGYNVTGTGGVGLNARSGPNTGSSIVRKLPEGAAIDISCQTKGENVRGSDIWDKLSDGTYISDFYTTTPVYAAYSPGIPVCSSSTPTQPKPTQTRETKAIDWAKAQKGSKAWLGYCDRFVANAYGRANSGYLNAGTHLAAMAARRKMFYYDYNAPAGAMVFFFPGPKNGWGGHVMISLGNGKAISSEHWIAGKRYGVGEVSIRTTSFGTYAGWAAANSEWKGR